MKEINLILFVYRQYIILLSALKCIFSDSKSFHKLYRKDIIICKLVLAFVVYCKSLLGAWLKCREGSFRCNSSYNMEHCCFIFLSHLKISCLVRQARYTENLFLSRSPCYQRINGVSNARKNNKLH